ncbi:MAG: ABC transporter ATP-binding protein/permease [Clostridia bacterium]|nr:ABC transporter ATP-binding protein/permease [Clostridia bacterium]
MLWLKGITKDYSVGTSQVHALKSVDLGFRDCELVAVLGQSGCGKTTMLNIIGGLDRYNDGDLLINGRSTKEYSDADWDSYRNHSIGFVFQTYNLIPHQTVLANVELALTLSGVGRAERRRRAIEALRAVGLEDQLSKKPNQMSGGQMQRVAIARALVNNPDILLADEPTGALDTETSIQVMDILREVARDRLVIMVTHNPELAEKYATRTVRLLDGKIISDTMPVDEAELIAEREQVKAAEKKKKRKTKKTSMSFATAMSLSLNNLMTKKTRTILTSFAGSIGIIGIALILALSTGINAFIAQVQEDTLSTYPLTIKKHTQDMSAMLSAMTGVSEGEDYSDTDQIHVDDSLGTMMSAMSSTVENNLEKFKAYIEENYDSVKDYVSDIQYSYDYNLQVYSSNGKNKVGMETIFEHMGDAFSSMTELMEMGGSGIDVFSEMINNREILDQQYDVIAGAWPTDGAADEVVLVVNSNNQISKMTLYMLGILDPAEIDEDMKDLMSGNYKPEDMEPYSYDYFLNLTFKLLTTSDFFEVNANGTTYTVGEQTYPVWNDVRKHPGYDQESFVKENGVDVKIVGIVRPKDGVAATSISGAIGYTKALTDYILEKNANSEVINQQKATPETNVLTGLTFERTHYTPETIGELIDKIDSETMETFYAYMTEQILNNEELSSKLEVNKDSFSQIFFLLPAENQAVVIERMLTEAKTNNPAGVSMLCSALSAMLKSVTVTPENITTLLPIFGMQELYVLIAGVSITEPMPMTINGLAALAGEESMEAIYAETTETLRTLRVNDDIFKAILATMDENDPSFVQLEETLYGMAPQIDETYESVLRTLDDAEKASPASINFYAKDFESKDAVERFISAYNDAQEDETDKLEYTDVVGNLMSSISIIINAISYVLIAFVAISLVVSSVMIGIITNISVLERTKEIGILRAVGASKKDVSRVFNAETLIIGLAAGAIGIILTVLLCIPITAIVQFFTGLDNIRAVLPIEAGAILVAISMMLTLIAGIIPSRSAAKKDPVIALRSE